MIDKTINFSQLYTTLMLHNLINLLFKLGIKLILSNYSKLFWLIIL